MEGEHETMPIGGGGGDQETMPIVDETEGEGEAAAKEQQEEQEQQQQHEERQEEDEGEDGMDVEEGEGGELRDVWRGWVESARKEGGTGRQGGRVNATPSSFHSSTHRLIIHNHQTGSIHTLSMH